MAELADAADSKSAGPCALGGSIPPPGTNFKSPEGHQGSDRPLHDRKSVFTIPARNLSAGANTCCLPFAFASLLCYSAWQMLEEFIRYWWLPVTRGMALVAFGVLALFLANNMSLALTEVIFRVTLVMLFGMYLGLSGSLTMVTAALIKHASHRWMYVAHGILLAALCFVILRSASIRLETIILLTAAHAMVNGLGEARMASSLWHHRKDALILFVCGTLSFAAAVALILLRNGPLHTMTNALGAYSLAYGIALAYFGWHLHRQYRDLLVGAVKNADSV